MPSRDQVLQKVRAVVAIELEDNSIVVDDATVIDDLPLWDSVVHFRIVIALEDAFGFLFELEEDTEFTTVGQLVDYIFVRLAAVTA